jgi:methyl-accepting chemotaxis protein
MTQSKQSQPGMNPSIPKRTLSLQVALVLPFLLQIFGAVGITGYLSIRNGQQTVNEMAAQLEKATAKQVEQQLDSYLPLVPKLAKINMDASRGGSLSLQNLTQVGQVFCQQMQNFSVGYAAFGTPKGEYIGVERLDNGSLLINEQSARTNGKLAVYSTTANCDRGPQVEVKDDYNFTQESWYTETVNAKKPIWSSIYNWDDKPEVMSVAFNTPIYNNGQLQGVMGGDFILTQLSNFLKDLKVSPNAKVYLIERNGGLIASSADQKPYKLVDKKAERLNALDSSDAINLRVPIQGETNYLNVTPWKDPQGLDWLIVTAIPQKDFFGSVNANTQQTILLCGIALVVSTALGIWTSRKILSPIQNLNTAADRLAHGDSNADVVVPESGITELNGMALAFNDMAQRLRSVMTQLQTDNQNLGAEVAEKNQALEEAVKRIRNKQDNNAQRQREARVKLVNLSSQIGYPVTSMQGELDHAQESIAVILAELANYKEQIKQLPAELRQEISTVDLDLMIADLQKRSIMLEKGTGRIDELSGNLSRFIAEIQQV